MKRLALIAAGAALALAGTAASAGTTTAQKGEARLARMLEGRTPGEPVSCINTMRSSSDMQVIDEVGLVYDAGKTIYVARARDPRMLRSFDVLVMNRFSPSRLCAQEPMRTIDRGSGFATGVVFLEDFVPYTREG
jgi:hypothetical protein